MVRLLQDFEDRLDEIDIYLEFLDTVEKQVQAGVPRIGGSDTISVKQQKILYSSVFLQLYNLIESTVSNCIDAVAQEILDNGYKPEELSEDTRREWVRFFTRTHMVLNFENRLEDTVKLSNHLIQSLPIDVFKIEKGQGGNWDDLAIQDICRRLGLELKINQGVLTGIKRPFRNDQGALTYIRYLRNELAHGTLSFVESGENLTVSELRDLRNKTSAYLREVVLLFQMYVDKKIYLDPSKRPI